MNNMKVKKFIYGIGTSYLKKMTIFAVQATKTK